MSTTTPNMGLILPDVGSTVGPDWANEIVAALTLIDTHTHVSGKGLVVPTAGISINANLAFNTFAATLLTFIGMVDQAVKPATVRSFYSKSGEAYWQDTAGNEVQLTSAGVINVAAGELTFKLITTYPYNILTTDTNKVLGITTTSARALTLPLATTAMYVVIKDVTGSGQTNNITVTRSGSDTVDGGTATVLDGDSESVGFISDGISKWSAV